MSNKLCKKKFKEELRYSETTYQRRMTEFKKSPFKQGYESVTAKEILIDIDQYNKFRSWKANNRYRARKVT